MLLPELEEIAKKRRGLGLKQAQLAKLASVSQSLIAKVESGDVVPSYSNAQKIFEALDQLESKDRVLVRDIMSRHIVGVKRDDKLAKIVKLLREKGISQVPVFDGATVVGSVSEQTILQGIAGGHLHDLSKFSAGEVMDEAFSIIDENTPVAIASALLRYSPAVLVSSKGKITGIVSKADLLKVVSAGK